MTLEIESLSQFVSHIKEPIWIRGKEDFIAKCLIREFLQKCSSDKIVEMLKSILSVEERMGLVKTELESFFQNQTKSFENHMMVKNELNSTDDQVQRRIKTEPKDIQDFIEKPKELKINSYKCILCLNTKYENSQDIESHLTNSHSISIYCQKQFIEKETSSKLTENIDENVVSTNAAKSVLESQTELSQSINEQQIEENESNEENIQNGDQHSDCSDSIIQSVIEMEIPRLSDSMEDIPDLSNNMSDGRSENLGGHEVIQDLLKEQVLLPCQEISGSAIVPTTPLPTPLASLLESQNKLTNLTNEQLHKNIESNHKVIKNNHGDIQDSDCDDKNTEENVEIEYSEATTNEKLSLSKKAIKNQSNKNTIRDIDEKTNIAADSKNEDLNISSVQDTGSYKERLLPYDWKKVALKRKNSDRWDFHVLSPQGKKLRSNIEIKKYLEVNPDIKCDRKVTNTSKKMVQIDSVSEISGDKGTEENKEIGDSEAKSNEKLTWPKIVTKAQKALEKQQETQDSETSSNEKLSLPKKATKNHKVTKKQQELVTKEKQETQDSGATSNEKLPLSKIATEKKQVTEEKQETQDFFPTSFYLVA